MNSDVILWLIGAVILFIIEGITISLVSIWFAAGALCAAAFAYYTNGGAGWQWMIFVIISLVLVAVTRPLAKKFAVKKTATNSDRIIGETGIVLKAIDPVENAGQVKVMGQIWSARAKDGNIIEESKNIRVLSIEGVKAIVEEIK